MNETIERIVRANPVSQVTLTDDDFVDSAALFSSIVSRRDAMTHTRTDKPDSQTADPTRSYVRPALVAVAAAMAVMIVVGSTILLFGGGESSTPAPPANEILPSTTLPPAPTTQASPGTTSATTTEPTTTTVIEMAAADFVSVEPIAVLDGGRIWDVAVGGPGLVAVGELTTPDDEDSTWGGPSRDAFILVSSDGREWERVDDPELFGGDDWDELNRIWASPIGLIAQGRDAEAPYIDLVWYASSDGLEWTLVTDDDLYTAWERQYRSGGPGIWFHEGGPGWVAVIDRDGDVQEVLVSSDGLEWEPTEESTESLIGPWSEVWPEGPENPGPDAFGSEESYYPWNMAWEDDRVVAVRFFADAMVGVSPDGGETWLRVDPELFADERQQSYSSFGGETGIWTIDVVYFKDTFVVVGDAYNTPGVWVLEWIEPD